MSMFWIGGNNTIVTSEKIKPEMYEDRIFLPGIIHGGNDYLIRVYLNDNCGEKEPEAFIIEYLTKELILKAYKEDSNYDQVFNEILACEADNFVCSNDGNGDFAGLIEAWPQSIVMSNLDLVNWARYM